MRKKAKKKLHAKKVVNKPSRAKTAGKKEAAGTGIARKNRVRKRQPTTSRPPRRDPGARSGRQSGDLQGLSGVERADSESVDELIEEGNAFEADVVAGVEQAEDEEEREVHTHEVPEDDVPDEYLGKE